jgi:hypothetical protein
MARDPEVLRAVTAAVLAHVSRCPNAADTAEGILEWWLTSLPNVDREDVRTALDELVRDGRLERASSASGDPVYRRARRGP